MKKLSKLSKNQNHVVMKNFELLSNGQYKYTGTMPVQHFQSQNPKINRVIKRHNRLEYAKSNGLDPFYVDYDLIFEGGTGGLRLTMVQADDYTVTSHELKELSQAIVRSRARDVYRNTYNAPYEKIDSPRRPGPLSGPGGNKLKKDFGFK